MFLRFIRFIAILILLAAVFGGVGYYIVTHEKADAEAKLQFKITLAVQTAIANALNDATRTAEDSIPHYRVITLGTNEFLQDVAEKYHTTVEVIRMANTLAASVESGSGEQIIVPEGVQQLAPPRRLKSYLAVDGDTLADLAARNGEPLEVMQVDNPILAQRGVMPGDIVFIAELL